MNLAGMIDHSILKAEAMRPEVQKFVAEAIEHRFASVCINGVFVADVAKALAGSGVLTCGVVGFPLGGMKSTLKAIEATSQVKDGAAEVDFVAHLPYLIRKDVASAKAEFLEIVRAARSANPRVVIKVIIESAVLMKDVESAEAEARIEAACLAARESGCDFIKTSTGFHPAGGASVEAVRLMKKHSGGLYVKASGGIRTYDDAKKMIDAGADRIGCSASVAILAGTKGVSGGY
ncbi:MAG: deoxyribose-phosphate aldolase [Planctomycetes bacterium]|nr:deoxyribose-phosphate aldolase [Planctomycetota bacterium]